MTGGFFCLVVQILTLGIDATGRFLIRAQVGIVSKSFLGEFNADLPPKVNSHSCSWIVFGLHLTNKKCILLHAGFIFQPAWC